MHHRLHTVMTLLAVYVSTGGFTKDAKYEADRSTVPLTRHCQVVDERRFSSWALSARARSAGARHFVPHAQGARSH